jgi:hypothetical protein
MTRRSNGRPLWHCLAFLSLRLDPGVGHNIDSIFSLMLALLLLLAESHVTTQPIHFCPHFQFQAPSL